MIALATECKVVREGYGCFVKAVKERGGIDVGGIALFLGSFAALALMASAVVWYPLKRLKA